MKLIIEIDEYYFEIIKHDFETGADYKPFEIIANGKPYEERPQGDLISRQDAIDALEEQLDYLQMLNKNENPTAKGKWYGVNWARNTIADLPYKQNERPQGHWIVESELKCLYYCSNCRSNGNRNQPFCGWCGADMRGEKE